MLSEAERIKIEEEERLRAEVRNKYSKAPKKRTHPFTMAIAIFIGMIVLIIIIANASSRHKEFNSPTPAAATITTPIFDVPALLGKNIDQIKAVLGAPEKDDEPTAQMKAAGVNEWEKVFAKDGKELLVTYNVNTRKVVDFFISANNIDPSGGTKDIVSLRKIGNVESDGPKYAVEPVKTIKDPSQFTGIKIVPR
jgi:hypothetical protein